LWQTMFIFRKTDQMTIYTEPLLLSAKKPNERIQSECHYEFLADRLPQCPLFTLRLCHLEIQGDYYSNFQKCKHWFLSSVCSKVCKPELGFLMSKKTNENTLGTGLFGQTKVRHVDGGVFIIFCFLKTN